MSFKKCLLTWKVGNIRRPALVTIISVPSWWNSSQRGRASRAAPAPMRAGCRGLLFGEDSPSSLVQWLVEALVLVLLLLLSLLLDREATEVESVRDEDRSLLTLTLLSTRLGEADFFTLLPAVWMQAGHRNI